MDFKEISSKSKVQQQALGKEANMTACPVRLFPFTMQGGEKFDSTGCIYWYFLKSISVLQKSIL